MGSPYHFVYEAFVKYDFPLLLLSPGDPSGHSETLHLAFLPEVKYFLTVLVNHFKNQIMQWS